MWRRILVALARAPGALQNPCMRQIILLSVFAALPLGLLTLPTRAQEVLYRCESADGISIQGKPCPKGSVQRKLKVQRPVDPAPAPPIAAPKTLAPAAATLTPSSAMRGPGEPYPLWQCMRADGSTFDSRNGVAGRQWVVNPDNPDSAAETTAPTPAKITALSKGPILRPIEQTTVGGADAAPVDTTPPPPGAAPGQWIVDQCTRLEPQQACERFATRRDALRKQIYAAKPSERATYAPEEQDLTSMLYAACGR
jgi:hypothetical protein